MDYVRLQEIILLSNIQEINKELFFQVVNTLKDPINYLRKENERLLEMVSEKFKK